ncbi:M81 family metallopeptidase [Virgibacillus halophilus]|uniref:M81 family metallopeptidase n=1 Tax=Tigheibacillus halophilus TaxID=361280 RepID=UPI00362F3EA2
MKIIVGGLYHESNTFNPFVTNKEDFVLVEGEKILDRVASTQVFREANVDIVPSIHAFGLSSGIVTKDAYRYFADKMLHVIKNETDIDGIWLHLHGSMTVEGIGSGELQLLKEIREIVGKEIPISLALDIHGNNAKDLTNYVNIIRAYRTVPHVDQPETEIITARLLLEMLEKNTKVKPAFLRLPMIIGGETALGAVDPLKSIFNKLDEMEQLEGIATASFFIGFSWADTENLAASVVVVPASEQYADLAEEKARELAEFVYDKRHEFDFDAEALEPDEAIQTALSSELRPVFISDSGDNTTGGAVGVNTVLLEMLLDDNPRDKKVCIAAIYDKDAFEKCKEQQVGDQIDLKVGAEHDEHSKGVPIHGVVKAKGDLMGYLGATTDKVGEVCTISIGNIDLVIANSGESFITIGHFEAAGLDISEYDIVVVKQGYLFDELSAMSELDILALTPGATYQLIEELEFKHIPRPSYPFEKETMLK